MLAPIFNFDYRWVNLSVAGLSSKTHQAPTEPLVLPAAAQAQEARTMIDPQPPDGDVFNGMPGLAFPSPDEDETDAFDHLQEDAEDEYGILPLNAVLTFWCLNILGVVVVSSLAGGILNGLIGAFASGLLGVVAYGASAGIFACLTDVTAGRLSRTVAMSAGIVAAAGVLVFLRPVEPFECVAALTAGALGTGLPSFAYREYLASAYHCPRYRFSVRDLLTKMTYIAFATAAAVYACSS